MNLKKYYWGLSEKAVEETEEIIRNPQHPKFLSRIFTLLSRCDKPEELFSLISKKQFIEVWPKVRRYWIKRSQAEDFRSWWETIYEQLLEEVKGRKRPKGEPMKFFKHTGEVIKKARMKKGWSQSDFARRVGMKQPDISAIERGKKNITLETLARLCKILNIKNIPLKE